MDLIIDNCDVWFIILAHTNVLKKININLMCKNLYYIVSMYIKYVESSLPSISKVLKNNSKITLKLKYEKNGWFLSCKYIKKNKKRSIIKKIEDKMIWISSNCTLKFINPKIMEITSCKICTDNLVVFKENMVLPDEWPY